MPFFHGIISFVSGWIRILTSTELPSSAKVREEFDGGSYIPAFLEHFFPGRYRVEVRRLHQRKLHGVRSDSAVTGQLFTAEVIRWSNASYQYMVRIKGATGWLSSFKEIGLIIQNSKKMSKRLVELVRLTSAWYFSQEGKLKVGVINHSHPECYVDGISSISRGLAIKCILSNKQATRRWRAQQIWKIKTGETACVILRMLTADGLIKGNALVLPRRMMEGYDVRTFAPNIKSEIRTTGWQWVTIEPTYGAIPVKSDDLTHAIYRGVDGLYDDATLMESLKGMLDASFEDMKNGNWMKWATTLTEDNNILHDKDEIDKYISERGLVGRIRVAVGQFANAGIPLTSSQTMMFMMVGSLRNMLLGKDDDDNNIGNVWRDKSRHWFPVPYAYAAHIYTKEVLELFGFKMPKGNKGFYHKATHSFVVPGEFFQRNLTNHGGPDLDDTVKVHIRRFMRADGSLGLVAFLLRNPNDFGEWSVIPVDEHGPVFHAYADQPPIVSYAQLCALVPQFTKLSSTLKIGSLPCMTNPTVLRPQFSLADEQRVREASNLFPAGVGATVIPKMIWYAMLQKPIMELCAPNEDIIDALQQGQATVADVSVIQKWITKTFADIGSQTNWTIDAFWYATRMPGSVKASGDWKSGPVSDSSWVTLHQNREATVRTSLTDMKNWLNANVLMPEVLSNIEWTANELATMADELTVIRQLHDGMKNPQRWVPYLAHRLKLADEQYGEAYTDRKVLRLMYASIIAKQRDGRRNYDQWLYAFTAQNQPHPYEWAVRALSRLD